MRFSWFKIMLAAMAVAFTVGCGGGGGGGGGDNDTPSPTPTIEFTTEGEVIVPENQNVVATLQVKNNEGDVTFSVTGGSDQDKFKIIDKNKLVFVNTPYYNPDGNNLYKIEVSAKDNDTGKIAKLAMKIFVEDKDSSIEFATKKDIETVENNTVVTTLSVINPVGDVTYEIIKGADADKFKIENNILKFVTTPDFENPSDANKDNVYEIEILAKDKMGAAILKMQIYVSNKKNIEFNIENNIEVEEEQQNVVKLAVSNNIAVDYELSGVDHDKFTITKDGILQFNEAPKYQNPQKDDNEYNVHIKAIDKEGKLESAEIDMTIKITPKTFRFSCEANVEVKELNRVVQTLTFENLHGDPKALRIEWTNKDVFTIAGNTLQFNEVPVYHENGNNTYQVTVTATDQAGLSAEQNKTITVTELDKPEFVSESNVSVQEYTSDVTTIKVIAKRDIVDFRIVDGQDSNLFNDLNVTYADDKKSAEGILTLKNAAHYDENDDNIYEISILAEDTKKKNTFKMFIRVNDVNESDVNITSAVYDDNQTEDKSDDTLTIYFSAEIEKSSFGSDIKSKFKIKGEKDCIGSPSEFEYIEGWPYKLVIKLNGSQELPDENTSIAIAKEGNLHLPGEIIPIDESPYKSVEKSLVIFATGQAISYYDGDDGYYAGKLSYPTNALERDDENEVVIDKFNRLMWQDDNDSKNVRKHWLTQEKYDICMGQNGQTQDDTACEDQSDDTTAKTYCEKLELHGITGWRLPKIEEMNSIIIKGKQPAISDAFKNVADSNDEAKGWYWSDTPCDECKEFAWAVQPREGIIKADHQFKTEEKHVRCVRDYEGGTK